MTHHPKLETVVRAYVGAMLWSTADDDCEPLDANYDIENLSYDLLASSRADCELFLATFGDKLKGALKRQADPDAYSQAGHDLWLTRARHGAGFWDGDWRNPLAQKMTTFAERLGNLDPYVGDDGRIYAS